MFNDLTAKRIICQKKRNGKFLDPLSGVASKFLNLEILFLPLNLSNLLPIDNTHPSVDIQCLELAYEKV